METIQYITQKGERWDGISQKAYGTPFEVDRIVEANPNVPVTPRLEAGVLLEIPVIAEFQTKTNLELLPPWKR